MGAVGAGQHRPHTTNTTTGGIPIIACAGVVGIIAATDGAGHVNEDEGDLLVRGRGQNRPCRHTDVQTVCWTIWWLRVRECGRLKRSWTVSDELLYPKRWLNK
jgi:hypothetical protein